MTKVLIGIIMISYLAIPATALEITAPEVPESGYAAMPENTDSLAAALPELVQNSIQQIHPDLKEAAAVCSEIIVVCLLFSVVTVLSEKMTDIAEIAGAVTIAGIICQHTSTMVGYASRTVLDICEYGKLLCPVLTSALAAQGGITTSAALFAGTTAFIALLATLVSKCFIPMLCVFLAFSMANCAFGEELLKKIADSIKNILHWLLKTLLIIFTTYMSLTGVVSGMTDAAALKAAKLTMSTVIPVVGGILSDASESVLISMGVVKNTAGIYGILATLAVFVGPFLKVGIQYLLLKVSALLCSLFADKKISGLIDDFSAAMGVLLAMIASSCILVLISTVCFMKGIG